MTVIAFRPRQRGEASGRPEEHAAITGTFQSPRGRCGRMDGILRVRRLVVLPTGTRIVGVFTAELREADGSLIGVDSRRTTVAVDVVEEGPGRRLVVPPLELDLLGMAVRVDGLTVETPRWVPTVVEPADPPLPRSTGARRRTPC